MKERTNDSGWVIEADRTYWNGKHLDSRGFGDADDAVRFSRFEDAERVKHWLMPKMAFALKTTEHIWVNS